MRINKFVAQATGLSRRAADDAIVAGKVTVNNQPPLIGQDVDATDIILLDGRRLEKPPSATTIILNKPIGYVCSRRGQGSKTVYELLPLELHKLKPVGRLDKDSSGLLLLTDDGDLANNLTHPSFSKQKTYEVELDKPLTPSHWEQITRKGVRLEDGPSQFDELRWLDKNDGLKWMVTMSEGRNRQIRRTFAALGYEIVKLHRTHFGGYQLGALKVGHYRLLEPEA